MIITRTRTITITITTQSHRSDIYVDSSSSRTRIPLSFHVDRVAKRIAQLAPKLRSQGQRERMIFTLRFFFSFLTPFCCVVRSLILYSVLYILCSSFSFILFTSFFFLCLLFFISCSFDVFCFLFSVVRVRLR